MKQVLRLTYPNPFSEIQFLYSLLIDLSISLRLHDVPIVAGENRDGPATGNWLVQRIYR